MIIGISALAVCIFVIPLLGMQNRLGHEKAKLIDSTNEAIKVTMGRIHGEVNADTYEKISGLNTTMSALVAERSLIKSISTWPWDTGTLRGFATTLLLPILLLSMFEANSPLVPVSPLVWRSTIEAPLAGERS